MIKQGLWMLVLLACPLLAQASDVGGGPDIPVLAAVPGCVQAKFGRVSISLGSKDARGKRGVGYAQAFSRLGHAAAEKGANAVVLRNHEATYITRSKAIDPRPGYIGLEGLAVRIDPADGRCALDVIDPEVFAERSREADRTDITTENRSF